MSATDTSCNSLQLQILACSWDPGKRLTNQTIASLRSVTSSFSKENGSGSPPLLAITVLSVSTSWERLMK